MLIKKIDGNNYMYTPVYPTYVFSLQFHKTSNNKISNNLLNYK